MSFETKEYGQVFAKGLVRDKAKHEAFKAKSHKRAVARVATLPGKFSVGDKTSPCENQGSCGSCWDFGVTKGLRSSHMLAGKDPGRLSFNYLLFNVGPVHEYGCGGGDFDAGENMLNGMGPCLYELSPYTQSDSGRYPKDAPVAATAKKWVLVGDGNHRPTAQQLCEALHNNGRGNYLVVDVAADDTWSSYSGGIYNHRGSTSINHIINCVGYDAETSVDAQGNAVFNADGSFKNGDGYFIFRNNWGSGWGENGDMRSRWGCNAVAETAMYFDVGAEPLVPTVKVTVTPSEVQYGQDVRVDVQATNAVSVVCAGHTLPPEGGTLSLNAAVMGVNTVLATATAADGTTATAAATYNVVAVPPAPATDSKALWLVVGAIVIAALGIVVGLLIK